MDREMRLFFKIIAFVLFLVGGVVGFVIGYNYSPDPTYEQVNKTITVKKMLTENEVNETGGIFSGFVIVSSEGIGYWAVSDALYFGFEVGETYCVNISPNYPQGPFINQNYGLGECK